MARILLVEDHAELAATLGQMLVDSGHEVEVAASVEQALQTLASRKFDLEIWDGTLTAEFDGLMAAVERHASGHKVLSHSTDRYVVEFAKTKGLPGVRKGDPDLLGAIQALLEDRN